MADSPYSLYASAPVNSLKAPSLSSPVCAVSVTASSASPIAPCLAMFFVALVPTSRCKKLDPLPNTLLVSRSAPRAVSKTAAAPPVIRARPTSFIPASLWSALIPPYSWIKLPA